MSKRLLSSYELARCNVSSNRSVSTSSSVVGAVISTWMVVSLNAAKNLPPCCVWVWIYGTYIFWVVFDWRKVYCWRGSFNMTAKHNKMFSRVGMLICDAERQFSSERQTFVEHSFSCTIIWWRLCMFLLNCVQSEIPTNVAMNFSSYEEMHHLEFKHERCNKKMFQDSSCFCVFRFKNDFVYVGPNWSPSIQCRCLALRRNVLGVFHYIENTFKDLINKDFFYFFWYTYHGLRQRPHEAGINREHLVLLLL